MHFFHGGGVWRLILAFVSLCFHQCRHRDLVGLNSLGLDRTEFVPLNLNDDTAPSVAPLLHNIWT